MYKKLNFKSYLSVAYEKIPRQFEVTNHYYTTFLTSKRTIFFDNYI